MDLKKRLEMILNDISASSVPTFFHLLSAREWSNTSPRAYLDPLIHALYDQKFVISSQKEQELRVTIREIILNSITACDEREDLSVEYTAYIGTRGLAVYIHDDGPGFDHLQKVSETREKKVQPDDETLLYSADVPGNTGLLCLLRYTSEFQYGPKGNEIVMSFKITKATN
ncbi:ATP-binding protein [Candidatus Woesearchaeota archaeon]|nr:ATP-binding protein [Candidatus Woesearchaeota archaeon]